MSEMTAAEVLAAVMAHHAGAAIVPELVIQDDPPPTDTAARHVWIRRIDALMIEDCVRTALEVKVSRVDAARESWAKVRPWWRVCHRFVYVVPAGLIDQPPVFGCGLWWVHPDGRVEVKRRARVSKTPEPLPQHVVQALAYRACGRRRFGEGQHDGHPVRVPAVLRKCFKPERKTR